MKVKSKRALIVDDDGAIAALIEDALMNEGFQCCVATAPETAQDFLKTKAFDILITDIAMRGMTGLDLLDYVRQNVPRCKVILITGLPGSQHIAQALARGAYDYIEKPFLISELVAVVQEATSGHHAPPPLPTRAAEAMRLTSQAKQASLDSVKALVRAVEAKDPYTRRHSEHVAHYATHLAGALDIDRATVESIHVAAILHDVGKIGVPDSVLTKPGKLTDEEFEWIRRHPVLGEEIVAHVGLFKQEARFVRCHHEDWDGSGYPDGLKAEQAPLPARIIRVADAIDAMLMARTYKQPYPVAAVLEELAHCAGLQFDPAIATAAVQWIRQSPGLLLLPGKNVQAA